MNVEGITDEMPARGRGISGHDRLHMGQKIGLGACGSRRGSHQRSGHHIATENEGAGAVADGLELASLHFARSQW
jgi:hypothetical protein